jgi:hypothetical protein
MWGWGELPRSCTVPDWRKMPSEADRRCNEYDGDMPADISSILLSNIGEIFAAVVEDSNNQ